MSVTGFDHIAVATTDGDRMLSFYKNLGFDLLFEDSWREGNLDKVSITCGQNKINVRQKDSADGSIHLCFVWEGGIDNFVAKLKEAGIPAGKGPCVRLGGRDNGMTRGISVYIRDPNGMVLEFISYDPDDIERYPGLTPEEAFPLGLPGAGNEPAPA